MELGLTHAICGNGKGKTTAAVGLGIRSCGRGLKVIMIQFLKGGISGELVTLKKLEPDFKVFRFEKERGFYPMLSPKEQDEVRMEIENAFQFAKKIFETKECDLLILDEILGVIENGILPLESIIKFISSKPKSMELVLTGRKLPRDLEVYMDYISRIEGVKHPFDRGIMSREGIES